MFFADPSAISTLVPGTKLFFGLILQPPACFFGAGLSAVFFGFGFAALGLALGAFLRRP
ncbi:hypothetical protein ACPCKP_10145 [Streptomyces cellulosae]|jgi:hypothetical protein